MNNSGSDVKLFRVVPIDTVMWKWINGCLGELLRCVECSKAAGFFSFCLFFSVRNSLSVLLPPLTKCDTEAGLTTDRLQVAVSTLISVSPFLSLNLSTSETGVQYNLHLMAHYWNKAAFFNDQKLHYCYQAAKGTYLLQTIYDHLTFVHVYCHLIMPFSSSSITAPSFPPHPLPPHLKPHLQKWSEL